MFITLYAYHAKAHQRDALQSLYFKWERLLDKSMAVSTELLCNVQDPTEMIMLARFPDEASAWALAESSDYRAWYSQLVSLADGGPIVSQYQMLAEESALFTQ